MLFLFGAFNWAADSAADFIAAGSAPSPGKDEHTSNNDIKMVSDQSHSHSTTSAETHPMLSVGNRLWAGSPGKVHYPHIHFKGF